MKRHNTHAARAVPGAPQRLAPNNAGRRRHIVISSFDSPGNLHYKGGGAAVVEMIASWLSDHFDVTIVTASPRGEAAAKGRMRYWYLPIGWAGPRFGQLLFHALLPFAVRRVPHDLWIESFTPPFSTSFLPIFSPVPVIGLAQNLSGMEMWGHYRLPFFLIERLGLRFYRNVVVLNPADRALVRRYSPSANVRVIPNCVDLPAAEDTDGDGDTDGEHILFLGRIDIWHKGLDLLLAAYKRSGLDIPLLVAGSGTKSDERKFAELVETAGGGVSWLGRVTGQRKQDLLARCSFLVMPSRHEAFGLSALEGMSHGKPIVHFDLPSLRWMDGDVRIPAFDVNALASQMRTLAADKLTRRRLGHEARSAAQHYGPDKMAESYVSLVSQSLASSP